MNERLIRFHSDTVGETYLTDFLTIVAYNIESSLLQSGAKPGTDYSYRDLFQLAVPIACERAKTGQLKWMYKDLDGPLIPD
jgi:hypothetical protein